jgi:F-type H+-transporting ATPase subunit epsilon
MADTFHLEVATPERLLIDEQVTGAQLPAKNGYLGVLAGHAPLLSSLGAGVLTYEGGGGPHRLAIARGFLEVFDNHVRVLADHADFPEDIDVAAARQELEKASEALKNCDTEAASVATMEAVQRAQAQIDAAGSGSSTASS